METLPQILEENADKDISALYNEIKLATESPVVNYIWRHLASIDGAAQWAWDFVKLNEKPSLSQDIKLLADKMARNIIKTEDLYPEIFLNESSRNIVEVYNNNNIENLVRVMMLLSALQNIDIKILGREPDQETKTTSGAKTKHIPNIPNYNSLNKKEMEIVDTLSVAGPSRESGIIPTLWIHLSTQHGLLEEIASPLTNILASSALREEYDCLRDLVVEKIKDQEIRIPIAHQNFDVQKAYDGLSRFSQTITELSLIGRVISQLSIKKP